MSGPFGVDLIPETPPERVLDAGCGTGENLCRLGVAYPGSDLFGLDRSEAMVRAASARCGHAECRVGEGRRCPCPCRSTWNPRSLRLQDGRPPFASHQQRYGIQWDTVMPACVNECRCRNPVGRALTGPKVTRSRRSWFVSGVEVMVIPEFGRDYVLQRVLVQDNPDGPSMPLVCFERRVR
jgi:hypothetical protein